MNRYLILLACVGVAVGSYLNFEGEWRIATFVWTINTVLLLLSHFFTKEKHAEKLPKED